VTVIDFTAFIGRLATASGETILPFFRTSLSIDNKSTSHDFDPVTEADRAAEAVMRRLIKASFPQHGIVGEEFGNEREDAEYVWVLDPIDGTKSFIAGFPLWGTLIALLHKGTPVFGMMHQPFIGERFSGDSYGHSGYTGVSMWVDPVNDAYFVLLTNSLHAGGHKDLKTFRSEAEALGFYRSDRSE